MDRKSFEQFKDGLSRLCFEGEGKGRIQLFHNKHLFRFESLDGDSSEVWKMGVNIPARGEEVLELYYQEVLNDGVKVRGKFITLLKEEIKIRKRKTYYLKILKDFISQLGLVLKMRRLGDSNELKDSLSCKNETCFLNDSKIPLEFKVNKQKFSMTLPVDDEHEFLLEGFSREEKKYRRMRGRIASTKGKIKNSNEIGINLFFDSCSKL